MFLSKPNATLLKTRIQDVHRCGFSQKICHFHTATMFAFK